MRALRIAAILAALAASPALGSEPSYLDWSRLVDAAAQDFEDPYRDVGPDQLNDLVSLVRLQERMESDDLEDDVRPRIEARIAQKRDALQQAGIDIDWLLAQRWVVAERRRAAALAVNPALDGAEVQVGGFLIPAPPAEDGTPTAYLVPERGMCSHIPPPPPNQLLRILAPELPDLERLYEPVVVRGRLEAVETSHEVFVVDGPVPMWSAWTLNAAEVEAVRPSEPKR